MPTKPTLLQNTHPYHLINKLVDPEFFSIPMDELWEQSCRLLNRVTEKYGLQTHAFVLMGNHFHLLATTPNSNVDKCMQYFQSRLATFISKRRKKFSIRFKGRYRASVIQSPGHFDTVLAYIYLNPVRANITQNPESYPYSTLFELRKRGSCRLKLFPSELGEALSEMSPELLTERIKNSPAVEFSKVICLALNKPIFQTS